MTGIELNPAELTIADNAAPVTVTATVTPEDASNPELAWSLSADDIVEIVTVENTTLSVKIKPLKAGEVTLTATAMANGQEVSATCDITVIPTKVQTLTLSAHTLLIDKPEGETLSVNFTPAEAVPTITWSADDDEILEIVPGDDQTYVSLKPLKTGVTTVSVEADGQTDECEVTVTDAAGIAGIFADGDDTPVDVYDLQGRTVLLQAPAAELRDLKLGFYIIRKGNEVKKVLVR